MAVVCGHGKPSAKRMEGALLRHFAPCSTVLHDMERSHVGLIWKAGWESETCREDVRGPGYLEGVETVNGLCSWIKRRMGLCVGMKPENLHSYLNWYVYLFRVKRQGIEWPETERVLRHLMMTYAHFRTKRDHG